jgi:hypothetical protein
LAGKVLELKDVLTLDQLACEIARYWQTWNMLRQPVLEQWKEVRRYKYSTNSHQTTNASLPWKNTVVNPKLTQIADNLWANYTRSLFPKRKWLIWEGYDKQSEDRDKKRAIEYYMSNVVEMSGFKGVIGDLLNDWIETGNCFVMPEWYDDRVELTFKQQKGYVGPRAVRINPSDIVFNPIAPSFEQSPKIVRKWVSLGDLQEEIHRLSKDDNKAEEIWRYLTQLRSVGSVASGSDTSLMDDFLRVDGFSDFRSYLGQDYAEILTFYGDLFVRETGEFYRNHIITIVDRHKLISIEPSPSYFAYPPIFHSSWRQRSDNLWGMGPLENLVGLQYRIDHLENAKADVMDLNIFPPLKIRGWVEDFEWGPGARIITTEEGDVDLMAPRWEILNTNVEIAEIERKMEELAGAPKEAMGIRTPGEKTKYEVQRLENAAGRIFQSRLEQFEEEIVEKILTAMLELARRKVTSEELRIFDDEMKVATFITLTADDITGNGRLRPVAARHFAEMAERVQNVTSFIQTAGHDPDIMVHFSGLGLARMFEELLDLQGYGLVLPFVRISEQAEAQSLINTAQEQNLMEIQTPSGLTPDDYHPGVVEDIRKERRQ